MLGVRLRLALNEGVVFNVLWRESGSYKRMAHNWLLTCNPNESGE